MKLDYPKAWFEAHIEREGTVEIGAGTLPIHSAKVPTLKPGKGDADTRIAFGQFITLWRRNKGWNAEKLADAAGIDTEEILQIEHDPTCEPEPDAVYKLAGIIGVPSRRLLELAGLVVGRSPHLREAAIRFAARSESIATLSDPERRALESFVKELSEEKR